jgi:hypothetical protein
MPPEVESFMLKHLAQRKHVAAQQSRIDLLRHFDQSRAHLLEKLRAVHSNAETLSASEYLTQTMQRTGDLWQAGSRLTARSRLGSALFFSTTNGRSVAPDLHIRAAIELAKWQLHDRQARDAMRTLTDVQHVVGQLTSTASEKVEYYGLLSSVALGSGYFQQGVAAAREALQLIPPGRERDQVEAELAEAKLLGMIPDSACNDDKCGT